MSKRTWLVAGVVVVALCMAVGLLVIRRPASRDTRTYRVGFENGPPFHFADAQGRPAGLAVDVVNEAARRAGVRITWVPVADSAEAGLRSGRVDLWPIITVLRERRRDIHFTDPYSDNEGCLIVPARSSIQGVADAARTRMAYDGLPVTKALLQRIMPSAVLDPVTGPRAQLERVCHGEADVAFMDEFRVTAAFMAGADCGGTPLRAIPVPASHTDLAMGSTFAAAHVADRLRAAISDMHDDGTLAGLIGRWTYFPIRGGSISSSLVEARRRERVMRAVTAGLTLFLFAAFAVSWRIRSQSLRARQSEAERARLSDQLQQAQRMESIGRLAGGVAHDFNNLLTVINGYADLLQDDDRLADDQRAQIAQIASAGGQAANLTQQLLAFSRKQVIEPRPLDLNAVISDLTSMLRRLLGENIALTTSLAPNLALVNGDPTQLRQVLMNLAINSRDAMPRGGQLRIETANVVIDASVASASHEAVPGPCVRLIVADTGAGMDREVLARVFEPFYTTKGKGEGTGLGLSMVYGIVRQSHGWVTVTSEPGSGTSFTVYLPQVAACPLVPSAAEAADHESCGTGTILLVEDQASVRQFAMAVLRDRGYTIIEADSAEQALALADTHAGPIDLLLTDVVLPGLTGKDLADRLVAQRPALTVLFASGYAESVIVDRGIVTPGLRFLQKPYAPHELAGKVREALASRDTAAPVS
jgi:signal transduction histidine kinase/CheY-like chemotaxis protein